MLWPICPCPWIHRSKQWIRPGVLSFNFQIFTQAHVGNMRRWDCSQVCLSETNFWTSVSKMQHHLPPLANHIKASRKYCYSIIIYLSSIILGFPAGTVVKNLLANTGDSRDPGFDPWVRKIPWRRVWQLTPIFLPVESQWQRSLEVHEVTRLKPLSA